jgi:hypothetical protein
VWNGPSLMNYVPSGNTRRGATRSVAPGLSPGEREPIVMLENKAKYIILTCLLRLGQNSSSVSMSRTTTASGTIKASATNSFSRSGEPLAAALFAADRAWAVC